MTELFPTKFSFKTRIIFLVGAIIVFLMLIISLSILFQWKNLIRDNELSNAKNLINAFSISAIDALIYAENSSDVSGEIISQMIREFKRKTPGLKYISFLDNQCRIIAHSDLTKYKQICDDDLTRLAVKSTDIIQAIYKDEKFGWIIDTFQPLAIGSKKWGTLRIAIDAQPMRTLIAHQFYRLLLFTILISSVTLMLLYYLIGRLTDSLKALVANVDKIDIDTKEFANVKVSSDEIGYLTKRFQALEKRLTHSRRELIKAQKQIAQAEKLASIGRLASGVAHEINNPLNGIKSCIYSINKNPDNFKKNSEYLELISEGLAHIEVIVQKLLGFARQQPTQLVSVDVNQSVMKVVQLLDYRFRQKNIRLNLNLDERISRILADEQNIQEVLMNILINSMDAVADRGVITVTSGAKDNHNIFVSVMDNGEGIADENLEIIFDPFFTTKDPGMGTGLGLTVSLGIIESYNGKIEVESKAGAGTTFTIILPPETKNSTIKDR